MHILPNLYRSHCTDTCINLFFCKDSDNVDDGEDEHSIAQHVKYMQMESRKLRPNLDHIRQRLKRTKKYRAEYISNHSTKEVLCQFPCLRRPVFVSIDGGFVCLFFRQTHTLIFQGLRSLT